MVGDDLVIVGCSFLVSCEGVEVWRIVPVLNGGSVPVCFEIFNLFISIERWLRAARG